MASFYLMVYFPFRYHPFLINAEISYADLIKTVFSHFHIDSNNGNIFLLQIFDLRCKHYVEFDDGYINKLRKRLPHTSVESLCARIVCRQQSYLLSRQSYFSQQKKQSFSTCLSLDFTILPPPYIIVWLDQYIASPKNFRSMKKYLYTATLLEGPINDASWLETDIDNLIRDNHEIDFDLSLFDGHLKMFTNVDECRSYISSQRNNLILLITSNEDGQKILPSINDRILNVYVLRNDWEDFEWGFEYIQSLQMFDDDQSMLTRIVQDLARYFVDEVSQVSPKEALTYLQWARKLYMQADKILLYRSIRYTSTVLKYIDCQLAHLETIANKLDMDSETE